MGSTLFYWTWLLPSAYWRSRGGGQCATLPPRWWSVKSIVNVLRIAIGESSFVHLGFTGGTGPERLACHRASCPDARDLGDVCILGDKANPQPCPICQPSPLTPVSGRSPFVRLGRLLNFWGAGLRQQIPHVTSPPRRHFPLSSLSQLLL